jgi:hypothetical protein
MFLIFIKTYFLFGINLYRNSLSYCLITTFYHHQTSSITLLNIIKWTLNSILISWHDYSSFYYENLKKKLDWKANTSQTMISSTDKPHLSHGLNTVAGNMLSYISTVVDVRYRAEYNITLTKCIKPSPYLKELHWGLRALYHKNWNPLINNLCTSNGRLCNR